MGVLEVKENYIVVGRASVGIYLILYSEGIKGKKVLVPANICYAAVYPILYSGNEPVFCDINERTGNIELKELRKYKGEIACAIIPHMYGNPVEGIDEISRECKNNKILLIEDCASAMGAEYKNRPCGSFGDYTIFSLGYSKTIDIGWGGLVLSDRNMDRLKEIYLSLPLKSRDYEANEEFFSKLYRLIRNSTAQSLDKYIWESFKINLRHLFVFKDDRDDSIILNALQRIDEVKKRRIEESKLYRDRIEKTTFISNYDFGEGAVPWRFNLLVDPFFRQRFIDELLKKSVPVSDWYPVVTPIFLDDKDYPNAVRMGERIVNFPLCIGSEKVLEICNKINEVIKILALNC